MRKGKMHKGTKELRDEEIVRQVRRGRRVAEIAPSFCLSKRSVQRIIKREMPGRAKKGAPVANQNRRKHGFYSKVLDEAQRLDLEIAEGMEGIDDEIALLRVKIKALLEHDPENVKLIMEATRTLSRLVSIRYKTSSEQKKSLSNAIGDVLRGLAIPLGIKYLP